MNEIVFAPHTHRWPNRQFFKNMFWSAAGACALGGLYAWGLDDRLLRIERRAMPLPSLGVGLAGATIAHVSDLHASPIVLQRYLRRCVEFINSMDVDFVAITGDFITGTRYHARRVARILGELSPRIATIACLGNHDYGIFHPNGLGGKRGLADYLAEQLSRADVFVMLNESRVFSRRGASIQFVGLEDYWSPRFDARLAFDVAHRHLPTVALCHNPDPAGEIVELGAHWVLAGHTHGRDLRRSKLMHKLLPTKRKAHRAGQYPLGPGRHLYVNRGLGYARRVNINARPEITVFTLQKAN